jgi:serine/threonine protein kinase
MNKTRKIRGGRKYGQGMKGITIDLCNRKQTDQDNFCRKIRVDNIAQIVLYVKPTIHSNIVRHRTLLPREIVDFFDFINHDTSIKNYIVKEFYNPFDKKGDFQHEIHGFENVSQILSKDENAVGMPYQNKFVVGFSIQEKSTVASMVKNEMDILLGNNMVIPFKPSSSVSPPLQYFVINRRCEQPISFSFLNKMDEQLFKQFVVDILKILVKLNKNGIVHQDIKPDNMMYCNGKFILIDWELSRKYTRNWFQDRNLTVPWPIFYLSKFGPIVWKAIFQPLKGIIMSVFGSADREDANKSTYIEESLEYYTHLLDTIGESKMKNKVKATMDQYTFGLVLYGVLQHNSALQKCKKYNLYLEFVKEIYRFDTPQKALKKFMTLL